MTALKTLTMPRLPIARPHWQQPRSDSPRPRPGNPHRSTANAQASLLPGPRKGQGLSVGMGVARCDPAANKVTLGLRS